MNLRETVSVSDYAALTIDVLDRLLYGYYDMAPRPEQGTGQDASLWTSGFPHVKRFMMDGKNPAVRQNDSRLASASTR